MAVPVGAIAKAAATVLSNEKLRKGVGWILVAVLSPLILIIAVICSLATGGVDHNNQAVAATFYGSSYSTEVPAEFRYHIEEMRTAFSLLDSAVSSANGQMDSGNGLDPIRVKAVFYALCFGEDAPSARAANRFVECFYTTETRTRTVEVVNDDGTVTTTEEEYTAVVPVSLYQAYANLEAQLGRTITEDDKSNINHIYSMIAGAAGGGSYSGEFLRGDGSSIELDISTFTDPMFFMSYIMSMCILMGATIDYGILLSTNYVSARKTKDRREALVEAMTGALPTIFTSGLILMVCGAVVGFVASQTSISSVGFLLFRGTLISCVMITVVLPALLYALDKVVMALTIKSKK